MLLLLAACTVTSTPSSPTPPPAVPATTDSPAPPPTADTDPPLPCPELDEAACEAASDRCFVERGRWCNTPTVEFAFLGCLTRFDEGSSCLDSPCLCQPIDQPGVCAVHSQTCLYPSWTDGCAPGWEPCSYDSGSACD